MYTSMWVEFKTRVPFYRVLLIRVPYYIGDLNREPNLENHPCAHTDGKNKIGLGVL